MLEPFNIEIDDLVISDLRERLDRAKLPLVDEKGWGDGIDSGYLHQIIHYWLNNFDWHSEVMKINRLHHLRGLIKGTTIHVVHERGVGPAPMPILLAHGWPDCFLRFQKIIPLLTDPVTYGGKAEDAFHVVIPSLPGYGYSLREGPHAHLQGFSTLFHETMASLGYSKYGVHGGDVGSSICEQLARNFVDSVVGLHLTDMPGIYTKYAPTNIMPEEQNYINDILKFEREGGGYSHLQGTKPATPSVALDDSPIGLAAWIIEKFQAWSDCHGNIESRFTKDELLSNIMVYWTTRTIRTSFLTYQDMRRVNRLPHYISSPTGFALFPKDIANPPRPWAERYFNVNRWSEMPSGGHFAALEEPESLVNEIRAFFRPLRLPFYDQK